jgi:ribosomal protein S25
MLVGTDIAVDRQLKFFKLLYREQTGYMYISRLARETGEWQEKFFQYPSELEAGVKWLNQSVASCDIYYCPTLTYKKERTKSTIESARCAWADLDHCSPDKLLVKPTITIESSPKRYQALWIFEEDVDPADAEDVSRRVAYYHKDDGADIKGWDLTQLLRVPFTLNHKYRDDVQAPEIKVIATHEAPLSLDSFSAYPPAKGFSYSTISFPTKEELDEAGDPDELLKAYRNRLMPSVYHLMASEPTGDSWSESLWHLILMLLEGGLTRAQVFKIAEGAACNKYKRDGRDSGFLWKEVCRAYNHVEHRGRITPAAGGLDVEILSDGERDAANGTRTFVEDYIHWAREQGDAAWQYHQAGAFVILSSFLAGTVRLPTSFGVVVPNMWFMILADTTLTRKTTAMDLSVDLITEVDSDVILATDGSLEGLLTALSMRPGRPSIFLRDEFSGLLDAMVKKDYMAGMPETLTKLYDCKFQKRILRKDIIEVRDPCLIFFAGGIRTRVLSLLTHEHVASGFMPRFVFITAESDVTKLRPLGPPTSQSLGQRELLTSRLRHMHGHYSSEQLITVNGKSMATKRLWNAELTPEAWARYNKAETDMLQSALKSTHAEIMTPTMDRLAKSGLKAAVLLAACRKLEENLVVEEADIVCAFRYVEEWRHYTLDVINNIGVSVQERQVEQIMRAIERKPGVTRSELMQFYHLDARLTNQILDTLDQREMITRQKFHRTERLWPAGVGK